MKTAGKIGKYDELRGLSTGEKRLLCQGRLDLIPPDLWERLCDGCAQCCLHKLYDPSRGLIYQTMIACRYLDIDSCRCKVYNRRLEKARHCLKLTPANVKKLAWLPETCAYLRIARGIELPAWHHLVSGSRDSVHASGHSARIVAIPPETIRMAEYPYYILKVQKLATHARLMAVD